MSTAPDPEALVRALAEEHVPPEPPEVLAARRERMVANISRSVRESVVQSERRTWLRRLGAAMAVAASLAASVGAYESFRAGPAAVAQVSNSIGDLHSVTGTLVMTRGGRSQVVPVATRLNVAAGDELRTAADGAAELQVGRSGIRVASATQLALMAPSSADERFRLASGRIDLEVSKQPGATRSVVVETPNADVVVRGTIFSVVVGAESGAPVTRVRVQEGSVWVLHQGDRNLVTSGEEWSSSSKPKAVAVPLPIAPPVVALAPEIAPARARASSPASPERAPVSAPSAASETGTLAEE
ncbi:MAG TPA: FecR family protein, partial [Polyangiaceae bacterium]|nr:FecR family protein [Polyangiaceae bacterium]